MTFLDSARRFLSGAFRLRPTCFLLAVAISVSATACGGGSDSDAETTPSSTASSAPSTTTAPANGQAPKVMDAPPAKESVEEAIDRIDDVLASGDCDRINELNVLSRPGLATEQRCEALQRLDGLEVAGRAAYGDLGGVVAYQRGATVLTVPLIRDADGLLHMSAIDRFTGEASTEGKLAPKFDDTARDGVRAMAKRDCDAFLGLSSRRFGIGTGSDDEMCERLEHNIVAALLERGGEAKPVDLEGGSSYAFFGVETPASYLTLIAIRQTEDGLPESLPKEIKNLPKGAGEYVILDALRTNPRHPIEASEG